MNVKVGFRKLKEQQQRKKIDHPLSKYNNLGQLTCIICSLSLKNELLWEPHLLSKKHREAVAALKAETTSAKSTFKKPSMVAKVKDAPPSKKGKYEEPQVILAGKSAQRNKEDDSSAKGSEGLKYNVLPADFFDNPRAQATTESEKESKMKKENASVVSQSPATSASASISEKLPEGFFDDAKMDAKVRKVEYVDKKEEEWEEFQKMIAEETKVSENLQAEEEDEIKVERDLAEFGALKQYLTRVDKLKRKRETQKNATTISKTSSEIVDDQDVESSGDELDDMLNWRAKKA